MFCSWSSSSCRIPTFVKGYASILIRLMLLTHQVDIIKLALSKAQ